MYGHEFRNNTVLQWALGALVFFLKKTLLIHLYIFPRHTFSLAETCIYFKLYLKVTLKPFCTWCFLPYLHGPRILYQKRSGTLSSSPWCQFLFGMQHILSFLQT